MRPRVLLLEDEPLIAIDVAEELEEAGFEVVSVRSTNEAVEWLGAHDPDLAILDVALPDGDCQPVAKALKSRGVPFLVHSGSVPQDFTDTAFAGAPWVYKPSSMESLLAAVHAVRA